MSAMSCYMPNCLNEIVVSCSCTYPPTFSCHEHLIQHYQSSIAPHNLLSFFLNPFEGTKEAMLNFLAEKISKADAIKTKILNSFYETFYSLENAVKAILKEIDDDAINFFNYFDKVLKTEKVSKLEKDPVISLLILQTHEAIEKANAILIENYNFESFYNMISLIDQAISSFNEELGAIDNVKLFKLENTEINFKNMPRNTQLELSKYERAIKADPNNADAWNSLGNIFYNDKRYEDAIKYYENAIKINANNAEYYTNKGNALWSLGRLNEVMDCFQKSINIDPNQAEAYAGIGHIFYYENQYELALEYYNNAIIIEPKNSNYYKCIGNTFLLLNRTEEAIECYKNVIIIDQNKDFVYNGVGLIPKNANDSGKKVENPSIKAPVIKRAVEIKGKKIYSLYK